MKKVLHFRVDSSLYNKTVRDAYWFEEGRKPWALDVLRCLQGITFKQEHDFLMGNAIFENSGDSVQLIYKKDLIFKKILQEYFFGDGKMKVPKDAGNKRNFSGWLTKEGFFIECKGGEHIALSEIICEKLKLLTDIHSKNYERILELNGAIKISSGLVLYDCDVTGIQVEILTKYIEDDGYLQKGGYGEPLNKEKLLNWLKIDVETSK